MWSRVMLYPYRPLITAGRCTILPAGITVTLSLRMVALFEIALREMEYVV
jgi:hypothetical protein